jgi:GT2 family glycosyltransferase
VCDADDIVDEHWASRLAEALKTSDLVGGGVIDWTGGARPVVKPHMFVTGFGFLPSFGGCNFGTHRRVWEAIDGFDEELRSGEDFDFAWRAQLAGYTYAAQPTAVVYYRVDDDPKAAFRRWRHYGTYEPALYAKFRGDGAARQPLPRAAAKWLLLAATSYRLVTGDDAARLKWWREAGRRLGRLRGSVRSRTLFL